MGHTFGHAIEAAQGYGEWLHGEAVATGMSLAMKLSAARGWVSASDVQQLRRLLVDMHLPVDPPAEMSCADFLTFMARDKKVVDGRLRLVLLRAIGEACIVDDVTEPELSALLGGDDTAA